MKIVLNKSEIYEIKKEEINLHQLIKITEMLRGLKRKISKDTCPNLILRKSSGEKCFYCNSENIVKRGWRYTLYGRTQKYYCKDCGKKFSNSPNRRMRTPKSVQDFAKKKRAEGLSYEKIQKEILKKFKLKLSRQTVHRWFKRNKI
jgi:transposase-like protein